MKIADIWKIVTLFLVCVCAKNSHEKGDLSLWIDEQQVKMFSGFAMEIYAIVDGHVLPYILDPNFEKYLPIIPSEVGYVNFTWKSGMKKYNYNFDRLLSFDEAILEPPVISIKTKGRVPRRPKGNVWCSQHWHRYRTTYEAFLSTEDGHNVTQTSCMQQ